jgi:hypothetical protein
MMVFNHGCKDFLPIGLPQTGDVGFEIVQSKPHVIAHVVIIKFHLQIANHEGRMKATMIGAVTCFNRNNDPVNALLEAPKKATSNSKHLCFLGLECQWNSVLITVETFRPPWQQPRSDQNLRTKPVCPSHALISPQTSHP